MSKKIPKDIETELQKLFQEWWNKPEERAEQTIQAARLWALSYKGPKVLHSEARTLLECARNNQPIGGVDLETFEKMYLDFLNLRSYWFIASNLLKELQDDE